MSANAFTVIIGKVQRDQQYNSEPLVFQQTSHCQFLVIDPFYCVLIAIVITTTSTTVPKSQLLMMISFFKSLISCLNPIMFNFCSFAPPLSRAIDWLLIRMCLCVCARVCMCVCVYVYHIKSYSRENWSSAVQKKEATKSEFRVCLNTEHGTTRKPANRVYLITVTTFVLGWLAGWLADWLVGWMNGRMDVLLPLPNLNHSTDWPRRSTKDVFPWAVQAIVSKYDVHKWSVSDAQWKPMWIQSIFNNVTYVLFDTYGHEWSSLPVIVIASWYETKIKKAQTRTYYTATGPTGTPYRAAPISLGFCGPEYQEYSIQPQFIG